MANNSRQEKEIKIKKWRNVNLLYCVICRDELHVIFSFWISFKVLLNVGWNERCSAVNTFLSVPSSCPFSVPVSDRVQALRYLQLTRQLLSCSADGGIAVWNMDTQREEVNSVITLSAPISINRARVYFFKQYSLLLMVFLHLCVSLQAPQWLDSDSCQKCEQPFFWNIKQMWDTKTLGLRQVASLARLLHRHQPVSHAVTPDVLLLLLHVAPLQEVWQGRVWEVQFQTIHISNHGLWVPSTDLWWLLWYHQRRRVSLGLQVFNHMVTQRDSSPWIEIALTFYSLRCVCRLCWGSFDIF